MAGTGKLLMTRRRLLQASAAAGLVGAPAIARAESARPGAPYGVQAGDVMGDRAIVWSRADRPARMSVAWSTTESMTDARSVEPVAALHGTGLTAKPELTGLPPGQRIFYEVRFQDLGDLKSESLPVRGSFTTPPRDRRNVRFVWGGDVAGQGWGINPEWGGMRMFATMAAVEPDFFIHSGDTIYADHPVLPEGRRRNPDGSVWRNLTIPEKLQVAETLDEFRMNHAYNLMDEHVRRFNAAVPVYAQWDDHEVTNNWYWEQRKDRDRRYREGSVAVLARRAMRAFHEYLPTRRDPLEQDRIFTSFRYGPSLEVFRIDLRSYRGANEESLETGLSPQARIVGQRQLVWLMEALAASTATWKVIACDKPLGVVIWDDPDTRVTVDGVAQGHNGRPLGRELEIRDLLRFLRDRKIKNVVWLTADIHYAAAHRYDPNRARFQDFDPFWEFVAGPLNAGTFDPKSLDRTFGPELRFMKAAPPGHANLPPSAGLQFFGQVDIDGASEVLTVRLKDLSGATLFTRELLPNADNA
jgi:alkaline phosphatase D